MGRGGDWELERFVERADRLRRTRLLQSDSPVELSYRFNAYGPEANQVQGRLTQPDEGDLEAFLLNFRPFVLQREPANLGRTYNQLHDG